MKMETVRLYEARSDVTLTAYLPDGSPEMFHGRRPGVIVCPGGAYLNLSDREGEPIAIQFAAMGYHAFVLRYSVYNEGRPGFPDLSQAFLPKEHCRHPRPMLDIAAAFACIHDHAKQWKVDVERIAVCGFSAGAHNCAMYAANWHTPLISEAMGRDAAQFRPAAAILCYGHSDYVYMHENPVDDPFGAALFAASNTAFLGTDHPGHDLLEEVSPNRHVTEHMPPTFLWATSEDALVPVQHTLIMAKALADAHIPFEVHVFEHGDHGLATATQSSAPSLSCIDRDAARWLPLCEAWLLKRFALKLPEKSMWEMG